MNGWADGTAVSLLNLLLSGVTANPGPESSQLVGQADASQPQHPGSGSQVSKISKLMSFSGSAPGSMCINKGCAPTMGQTKPTRRQLLFGSPVIRQQAANKKHLARAAFGFSSLFFMRGTKKPIIFSSRKSCMFPKNWGYPPSLLAFGFWEIKNMRCVKVAIRYCSNSFSFINESVVKWDRRL